MLSVASWGLVVWGVGVLLFCVSGLYYLIIFRLMEVFGELIILVHVCLHVVHDV